MVSEEEIEKLMLKYLPQCPLCGSNKGYVVSGIAKTYVQCRSCGAKWMSSDFPNCKEIKEMYLSEPAYDGRGNSLRMRKKYPMAFWQDLVSVQNALKMEETKKKESEDKKVISSELIFQPEMTNQQLDALIKKSLEEITRWDYGSTFFGKFGPLLSDSSFTEAATIRLLRAIFEQNKITMIQNELLRRALLEVKTR